MEYNVTNLSSCSMYQAPVINFSDPNIPHNRVLLVAGVKFHVRAELLAMHSDTFKTLLNLDLFSLKEIRIDGVFPEHFGTFLNIFYKNYFAITDDNYRQLISLASRFRSPIVLQLCQTYILNNMATMDKIELIDFAYKNDLHDIMDKAAERIAIEENDSERRCSETYKILSSGFVSPCNCFLTRNHKRLFELPPKALSFLMLKMLEAKHRRN